MLCRMIYLRGSIRASVAMRANPLRSSTMRFSRSTETTRRATVTPMLKTAAPPGDTRRCVELFHIGRTSPSRLARSATRHRAPSLMRMGRAARASFRTPAGSPRDEPHAGNHAIAQMGDIVSVNRASRADRSANRCPSPRAHPRAPGGGDERAPRCAAARRSAGSPTGKIFPRGPAGQ